MPAYNNFSCKHKQNTNVSISISISPKIVQNHDDCIQSLSFEKNFDEENTYVKDFLEQF